MAEQLQASLLGVKKVAIPEKQRTSEAAPRLRTKKRKEGKTA
jgi:hypothetical protein